MSSKMRTRPGASATRQAGGIEVFFDQSELRGGKAWDQVPPWPDRGVGRKTRRQYSMLDAGSKHISPYLSLSRMAWTSTLQKLAIHSLDV